MCGRCVAQQKDGSINYNLTPGTSLLVKTAGSTLTPMTWGLVPAWAEQRPGFRPLINARCETIFEKPSFREAIIHNRCIIPMQGYYEWYGTHKHAYFITNTQQQLNVAGIYYKNTCAVITKAAHSTVDIHHRSPVILDSNDANTWITDVPRNVLEKIFINSMEDDLVFYRVSSDVNSPYNNSESLIYPLPKKESGGNSDKHLDKTNTLEETTGLLW